MIRVGIVGMGFGASMHVPVCIESKDFLITALSDNGSGTAKSVSDKFALSNVRIFHSGEEMAICESVDAVIVAVPAASQYSIVAAALKSGKHVLCEKPLGLTYDEAEHLYYMADAACTVTAVCYEYRYDKVFTHLFHLINNGEMGRIKRIEVDWHTSGALDSSKTWSWKSNISEGGGVLSDWAPHVLDYISTFMGGDLIGSLSCQSWVEVDERIDNQGRRRPVTAPDNCLLVGEFSAGVSLRISISMTHESRGYHKIKVVGELGEVVMKHDAPFTGNHYELTGSLQGKDVCSLTKIGVPDMEDTRRDAVKCLMADFAATIRTGERPKNLPSFSDALKVWRSISPTQK